MDFKPFKNNNKDHLEFYLENSISPVHQNIKNLNLITNLANTKTY